MIEKRFIDDGFEAIEDQSFTDNLTKKTYYVDYFDEVVDLCNSLWEQTKRFEKHNKDLMEENEQLKQSYLQLKHRHSLLHDVCVDAECDRDSYHKDVLSLEKENEQLKKEIESWKKHCITHGIAVPITWRDKND